MKHFNIQGENMAALSDYLRSHTCGQCNKSTLRFNSGYAYKCCQDHSYVSLTADIVIFCSTDCIGEYGVRKSGEHIAGHRGQIAQYETQWQWSNYVTSEAIKGNLGPATIKFGDMTHNIFTFEITGPCEYKKVRLFSRRYIRKYAFNTPGIAKHNLEIVHVPGDVPSNE